MKIEQNTIRSRQQAPAFKGIGKITHIEYHKLNDENIMEMFSSISKDNNGRQIPLNLKKVLPNFEQTLNNIKTTFQKMGVIDENNNFILLPKKITIDAGNEKLPDEIIADEIIMLGGEQERLIGNNITLSGKSKLTQKAESENLVMKDESENLGEITSKYAELKDNAKNIGTMKLQENIHLRDNSENHGIVLTGGFQQWGTSKNMTTGSVTAKQAWLTDSAENHGAINCNGTIFDSPVPSIEMFDNSKNMKTGKISTCFLTLKENVDNNGLIIAQHTFLNTNKGNNGKITRRF